MRTRQNKKSPVSHEEYHEEERIKVNNELVIPLFFEFCRTNLDFYPPEDIQGLNYDSSTLWMIRYEPRAWALFNKMKDTYYPLDRDIVKFDLYGFESFTYSKYSRKGFIQEMNNHDLELEQDILFFKQESRFLGGVAGILIVLLSISIEIVLLKSGISLGWAASLPIVATVFVAGYFDDFVAKFIRSAIVKKQNEVQDLKLIQLKEDLRLIKNTR